MHVTKRTAIGALSRQLWQGRRPAAISAFEPRGPRPPQRQDAASVGARAQRARRMPIHDVIRGGAPWVSTAARSACAATAA